MTSAQVPVRLGPRTDRPLHPRRGPHDPASSTPARRPGSVRRTTTHDSRRDDGLLGDVSLTASGRDLLTDGDGRATVLAEDRLDLRVDYMGNRRVLDIAATPADSRLDALVGVPVSSGFRQAMDDAVPGERADRPLRYQLLDDLPTALLVSGYALGAGGARLSPRGPVLQHADLCAGWATGGTIMVEMVEHAYPPIVTGPDAPNLARDGDALAWHDTGPALTPHGMRRWRRIDLWPEAGPAGEGGATTELIAIECFFRDSHVSDEGLETVIHEYTVRAAVDPADMRFTACEASIGALPWQECPSAAASAGRLVGAPVEGLRQWVRDTFIGPPTCTHLNDTLRSLADVPELVAALDR